MNIQSLSVVVPNKACINNCKFCVSRMRTEEYPNQMSEKSQFYDLYLKDYKRRLEFARDNGCNTVMLTGSSEPQQNKSFLQSFAMINDSLERPFRWIEIQTTGILLDDNYLRFLRNTVGVSTISLSVSNLWSDVDNRTIIDSPDKVFFLGLEDLCKSIKKYDFNLRLSINLLSFYEKYYTVQQIFDRTKDLGADQATFRVLYADGDTPQADWVRKNTVDADWVENSLNNYIKTNGKQLETLPYGRIKYSVNGIGVVVDDDCMSKKESDTYKYLILREDCKLYSKWDDKGSLVF